MKTKIAAVMSITIVVLITSFLLLKGSIANILEEEYTFHKVETPAYITNEVKVMPSKASKQLYRSVNSGSSSYSASGSVFSEGNMLNSSNMIALTNNNTSKYASPFFSHKRSGSYNARLLNSIERTSIQGSAFGVASSLSGPLLAYQDAPSGNSAPFSGGNSPRINGMMRMFGDDDNPPPEGAPVGGGFIILAALALIYGGYKRIKLQYLN